MWYVYFKIIQIKETIDTKSVEGINADVNIKLSSPIIFIKDPRPNIDRWIIINLGTVVMSTKFEERNEIINGKEEITGNNLCLNIIRSSSV